MERLEAQWDECSHSRQEAWVPCPSTKLRIALSTAVCGPNTKTKLQERKKAWKWRKGHLCEAVGGHIVGTCLSQGDACLFFWT